MREALHQWSTNSYRGPEGLTPRRAPSPEEAADDGDADDGISARALPTSARSLGGGARRVGGRVSQSPAVLSSAPTPPPRR